MELFYCYIMVHKKTNIMFGRLFLLLTLTLLPTPNSTYHIVRTVFASKCVEEYIIQTSLSGDLPADYHPLVVTKARACDAGDILASIYSVSDAHALLDATVSDEPCLSRHASNELSHVIWTCKESKFVQTNVLLELYPSKATPASTKPPPQQKLSK